MPCRVDTQVWCRVPSYILGRLLHVHAMGLMSVCGAVKQDEESQSRSMLVSDGAESLVGQPESPSLALSIPPKQLLSPGTEVLHRPRLDFSCGTSCQPSYTVISNSVKMHAGHLPFHPIRRPCASMQILTPLHGSTHGVVPLLLQSSCTLQGVRNKEAPETSANVAPKVAPTLKERLAEALREIERLQTALEEANQQQEWVLGNVVKISEAEKEELTRALQ